MRETVVLDASHAVADAPEMASNWGIRPVSAPKQAHRVPGALGAAYNRTKFLSARRVMMQQWADYLDKLKAGAEVILLRAGHVA